MGERSQADNLFLESFWVANVKDESDAGSPFQAKAEFSHDVEGNEREDQIGSEIWGKHLDLHQSFGLQWSKTIERLHDGQVELDYRGRQWGMGDSPCGSRYWVPQNSIKLLEYEVLESLHYDIEVPCVVQWRMLWYSAPTSFRNDLINDGDTQEKYGKADNMAIKTSSFCPFWRRHAHTKTFFFGSTEVDDGTLHARVGVEI